MDISNVFRNDEIKILLVEDNPVDVLMITHTLEMDYPSVKIVTVELKDDYIKALNWSDFDLILCDHFLSDMTSLDALEILKETGKEIPFIVVTASGSPDISSKAIKEGAYDYLLKSDTPHLTITVRNALNHHKLKREVDTLRKMY